MCDAAGESFSYLFWKAINFWNDNELFSFLVKQNNDLKNEFCNFMTQPYVTWPIQDYKTYYKMYYPKTWQVIRDNITRAKRRM